MREHNRIDGKKDESNNQRLQIVNWLSVFDEQKTSLKILKITF